MGPKRRKAAGASGTKKKPKLTPPNPVSNLASGTNAANSATAQSTYLLDLDFPVTEAHENTNAFMEMYKKSAPIPQRISYIYAPMPEPKHVLELEVYENRRYVLDIDAVGQVTATYPGYGSHHEYYPDGHITYWTLKAYDANDPDGEKKVLDLFLQPPSGRRLELSRERMANGKWLCHMSDFPNPAVGAITTAFCTSRENAIALGNIVCEVLNRVPTDVDWEFNQTSRLTMPFMRKFVERTALVSWRSTFDFRQLPSSFVAWYYTDIGLVTSGGLLNETAASDFTFTFRKFAWSTDGYAPLAVTGSDSDLTAANEIEACPEGFYLGSVYTDAVYGADEVQRNSPQGLARKARITSARRILDKVLYDMCGFVGTDNAIRAMVRERTRFGRKDLVEGNTSSMSLVSNGLLDTRSIIGIRVPTSRSVFVQPLRVSITTKIKELYTNAEALLKLPIWLRSFNRIDIAYVKERFLQALRDGRTVIQAIFATCVAADLVNLRVVTHEGIRLETSIYASQAERSTTQHVCFGCNAIKLSREMILTEDGGIYDQRCSEKIGSIPAARMTVQSCFLNRREIEGDPTADLESIRSTVIEDFVLDDGISYLCAYDGTVANAFASIEGHMPRVYLDTPSLEKPLQATCYKGKTALHAPNNAVVCRTIFNRLKFSSIVAFMGWVAELLRLRELIKDKPVQEDYDKEVEEDMKAFDAYTDNSYIISKKLPHRNTDRLALQLEADEWHALQQESMSGLWDGQLTTKDKSGRLWLLSNSMDRVSGGKGPEWDDDDIEVLKKDLHDMQNSPKFNPHGLTLPINKDGSPCLWRREVLPPDIDWNWLNRYMREKLKIWRQYCNKGRPTEESAATLLLLYVLWWLRTGGKCHIFGFRMTPWPRYDTVSSIGRGVYFFDHDGEETDIAIIAGMPLRSGFLNLLPTDVNDTEQFDWTKMTAMVESWKANTVRYKFPVAVCPELWNRLRLIAPSKLGLYEARKTLAEYTRHEFLRPPPYATTMEDEDEGDDADEEAQVWDEENNSMEASGAADQVEVNDEVGIDDADDEVGGDKIGDGASGVGAHEALGEQVEDAGGLQEQVEDTDVHETVQPYLQDCVKRLTSQHVDQFRSNFTYPIQLGEALRLFEEGKYKEAKDAADFLMDQMV